MELMFLPDNNIENITNSIDTTAVTAYMKNLIDINLNKLKKN